MTINRKQKQAIAKKTRDFLQEKAFVAYRARSSVVHGQLHRFRLVTGRLAIAGGRGRLLLAHQFVVLVLEQHVHQHLVHVDVGVLADEKVKVVPGKREEK